MNKAVGDLKAEAEVTDNPLAKLREPFLPNQISKLPKETGAQAKQRKADQDAGKWPPKCAVCDGYHHPKAVHLDYVGHAAATDRLLDADPRWNWEPMALTPEGLPAFDKNGGLWIKLTVDGVTRIGYGSADGKTGGDAIKEIIGDALRNSGMRFGMALDLWHKGQLHADEPEDLGDREPPHTATPKQEVNPEDTGLFIACKAAIDLGQDKAALNQWAADNERSLAKIKAEDPAVYDAVLAYWRKRLKAACATQAAPADLGIGDDEIPY